MRIEKLEDTVTLPEGVTGSYVDHVLTLKGAKGELSRQLFDPRITIAVTDGKLVFTALNATMREKKLLFTFKAHAKNMAKGITDGFTYRLKVCSGHFPMSVAVKDGRFEVKNFIGEKVPRILALKKGVDVKLDGEVVTVTGTDKEAVGQVAGDIEQLTRRPGFDSRIFQDGIFIIDKDGKHTV